MQRIEKLQKLLSKQKYSAVLISKPQNVFYLSGFKGSNGLLYISRTQATLITDFRYLMVAKKQLVKGVRLHDQKNGLKKLIGRTKVVAFEDSYLTVAKLKSYKKVLKGIKLVPIDYLVEKMRMIKDKSEINIIKEGVIVMEKCLKAFIKTIKIGQSEDEMEWNLFSIARKLGADGFSFPPIICFDKHSADVHHQRENLRLKKKEKILLDFGIEYKGYMTDMTRMIYLNGATKVEHKIYSIVLEANESAIKAVKVGEKFSKLDKVARSIIEKAGYGENFGHSTGHGVGLKIHEAPNVSEKSTDTVQPGMVFTIEPGIYIDGVGGVRIEDMVYIGDDGKVEVLTQFPKGL